MSAHTAETLAVLLRSACWRSLPRFRAGGMVLFIPWRGGGSGLIGRRARHAPHNLREFAAVRESLQGMVRPCLAV
jgi:hypothetical protein